MGEELLPCPFCGSPARLGTQLRPHFVECCNGDCDCYGPSGSTSDAAIAAWNKRAQHAREADKLPKELGDIRALFPVPEEGSPLEGYWIDAMSDPYSVADYVRVCIAAPQPAALSEGWISVDERLPDFDVPVLGLQSD